MTFRDWRVGVRYLAYSLRMLNIIALCRGDQLLWAELLARFHFRIPTNNYCYF